MVRNSSQPFAEGFLGNVMKKYRFHSSGRLPERYISSIIRRPRIAAQVDDQNHVIASKNHLCDGLCKI